MTKTERALIQLVGIDAKVRLESYITNLRYPAGNYVLPDELVRVFEQHADSLERAIQELAAPTIRKQLDKQAKVLQAERDAWRAR